MINTTKVKTFQPTIPDGVGGVGLHSSEALYDILQHLYEKSNSKMSEERLQRTVENLNELLEINNWIDGEYTLFEDYKIKVYTYAQYQLDEMKDFSGY